MAKAETPVVGIIMGSQSDWETMKEAALILETLNVPHENPDRVRAPDAYADGRPCRDGAGPGTSR